MFDLKIFELTPYQNYTPYLQRNLLVNQTQEEFL